MTDTGSPITVPVGPEILGRIINVIGEPIDQKGKVSTKERWSIHRPAPKFTDQSTETEILVTGIKVVDLSGSLRQRRKDRFIWRSGRRQNCNYNGIN